MAEFLRKLLLALGLACLGGMGVGCPGPTPPKPTPTPPVVEVGRPSSPVGLELLVRTENGQFRRNGQPFARVGGIPCWPTDGTGDVLKAEGKVINYYWPLVSRDWVEYATSKGVNFFHARPGPISAQNVCCGLQPFGPPYNPDGSHNQKFWDVFHDGARAAVEKGANFEVDVVDGWIIKHVKGGDGDVSSPLNTATAMNVPLAADVKAWIGKVIYESCNYGNVTYQVSNESGLIQGWTPEWERAIVAEVRLAEQQAGCGGIVHVVGSNSMKDDGGPYEYLVSHNPAEPLSPTFGKPMVVNEYNPALQPGVVAGKVCEAKAKFQGFDYWRSDGSDDFQNQTMELISAGCVAPPSGQCPAPQPDKSKLAIQLDCSRMNSCDATPIVRQSCEYCNAIGMGEINGTVRCSCPMRNEGDPNRLPCEQYALERWAPLWRSDGQVSLVDADGFRARTTGTWLEACNADGSVCSERKTFNSGPEGCNVPPLVPSTARASTMQKVVRDAQQRLGDVCGADPTASLQRLATELVASGVCAAQRDDAVFVQADAFYEEHHAVFYGNGCWLSNSYRGSYEKGGN